MEGAGRAQSPSHAGSEKWKTPCSAPSGNAMLGAWNYAKTTSIPLQAGTGGPSTAPSATEHACTAGAVPSKCSTQTHAERASSLRWAKRSAAESAWSTRSFASTGAVQPPPTLQTTRSWSQLASRGR